MSQDFALMLIELRRVFVRLHVERGGSYNRWEVDARRDVHGLLLLLPKPSGSRHVQQ